MLDSINLNNKSFEQIRDEAAAQIPLYSKDWTNYNVSFISPVSINCFLHLTAALA